MEISSSILRHRQAGRQAASPYPYPRRTGRNSIRVTSAAERIPVTAMQNASSRCVNKCVFGRTYAYTESYDLPEPRVATTPPPSRDVIVEKRTRSFAPPLEQRVAQERSLLLFSRNCRRGFKEDFVSTSIRDIWITKRRSEVYSEFEKLNRLFAKNL